MTTRRYVRHGEALAIDPRALHHGVKGGGQKSIWWDLFGPEPPANDRLDAATGAASDDGDVCVVHVRGSLEHHEGYGGDSYEAIRKRVQEAIDSDARTIVLRVDSPGGVVSGLNETVRWLRMCPKPLIAYVDELAASAAFALTCGCDETYAPRSAIVGSVGVISTMMSQARADQKAGLDVVTIASGKRKSDGHPHVLITDEAQAVEQDRVERLAAQFYQLVADARPIPLATLEATHGYEAGIFLARKALRLAFVDGVMSWDSFLSAMSAHHGTDALDKAPDRGPKSSHGVPSRAKGNETDRRATPPPDQESAMLALTNALTRLKAQLASVTDAATRAALETQIALLAASIEAGTKIQHEKHEKKTVTKDGDGDDKDDGDSDDGDGDAEEEDEEESAETSDDSDEDEDEEEDEEEEGEEEEKCAKEDDEESRKASLAVKSARSPKAARLAILAAIKATRERYAPLRLVLKAAAKVTGQTSPSAIAGALAAMPQQIKASNELAKKVAKLEQDKRRARVDSMLRNAKAAGKLTPAAVESLREAGLANPRWLKGHLATLPTIARTSGFTPREGTNGAGAPTNAEQAAMLAAAKVGMSKEEAAAFDAARDAAINRLNGSAPRI